MVRNTLSLWHGIARIFTKMEETLGNVLRTARKTAGISVNDAVYLAKMPRGVVEALEAENFGFFSSPLYARSFLQQYGDYVGADVEPWLDDLEPTTMIDGEAVESFIDISEPVAAAVTREKPKGHSGGGTWAAVWMVLITAGLVWAGITVYEKFENKLAPSTETAGSIETTVEQPPADETSNPEATATNEVEEIPAVREDKSVAGAKPEPPRRAIIVREE